MWLALAATLTTGASGATAQAWSPTPWLADLVQIRGVLETRYANIAWLTHDRGIALGPLFDRAGARIRAAGSDTGARGAIDRLIRRIGDGHVEIDWPAAPAAPPSPAAGSAPDACATMGFDATRATAGVAPALSGYRAVPGDWPFPAGIVRTGPTTIGVIRIGGFEPQGYPALCRAAHAAQAIPDGTACDDDCQQRILDWSYRRMDAALAARIAAVRAAGARTLLIDVTGNGGGTEWAEAVARMVTDRPLHAERLGFVRTAVVARQWADLATQLRAAARGAPADRARLLGWAGEAQAAAAQAAARCRERIACDPVARAGFATGLLAAAPLRAVPSTGWGPQVFSPAQFDARPGTWAGPLIVLVDDESWSAAEEFAATLQDNHAALIVGARTGGAGCGHAYGEGGITLANSHATLSVPDCVRFRADGTNEVRGVVPDLLLALRASDGAALEAAMVDARLADAARAARTMRR